MRKIAIATIVLAAVSAMQLPAQAGPITRPTVAPGTPALQTPAGRYSLCRAHLLAQGYPWAFLYRQKRASTGIVGTCARQLYAAYR
jgi:hypothetical protein